jgi:aminopeptidase
MAAMMHTTPRLTDELGPADIDAASAHLATVLSTVFGHDGARSAMIVADGATALARTLTAAYQRQLPDAPVIDFDSTDAGVILAALRALAPGDLVVLVQSSNFRLDGFRLRVELFKLGLKVIEHLHLNRMPGAQGRWYIAALEYDAGYYRGVGPALKARIDAAAGARVVGDGLTLHFDSPLEPAKLNIGDYSGMHNVGGQFPIGEVFTEAQNLEAVHGRVRIHVFGDTDFLVNRPPTPITLVVDKGRVIDTVDSTTEFDEVLARIRADEGEVWLRELGFGMNRAFSRERLVDDIGTYERMCGIHLSLGAKHGVYPKPGFKRKDARYHVDVFAVTDAVWLDEVQVYSDGRWQP